MDDEQTPDVELTSDGENKDDKSISSDLIRGHINTIILRALYDGDKYGYEIMAEIERKSHGQYSIKEPSLYSALKRLEKNGYVTSYWGGSVAGGRRKYFSLTDEGKLVSEQNQSEWEYSRTVIDSLISDKDFDFSNPAPTQVDMRVLRSSTSRVPSREGEGEELDFAPVFDDTEERQRLTEEFEEKESGLKAEYEQRNAALSAEYEQRKTELDEAYEQKNTELSEAFEQKQSELNEAIEQRNTELNEAFEQRNAALLEEYEQKHATLSAEYAQKNSELSEAFEQRNTELNEAFEQRNAALSEEYEQKNAALEEERRTLAEQRRLFEEEMANHDEAVESEQDWREQELAAREQALAAERERLEAMRSEQVALTNADQEQREAALVEEAARLEERKRAMDEEETARRAALEAEESERRRILDEELEERRQRLDAEEEERKRALEAEEAAKKNSLAAEEAERKRILDEEEASRKRIIEEREQQFSEREAFFTHEHARFAELLRQRDEQIDAERRAHMQELAEQERRIVQEQETIFRQREQQLLHKNYLDLVNGAKPGTSPSLEAESELPARQPSSQEYRSVVQGIYAGAVQNERTYEPPRSRSLDGIDFHDLESRASRDGIKISTTGGNFHAKTEKDVVNTVHKGKMLFLSAIVLLFVCIVEGAIVMAVRNRYALPVFYPYLIWAIGVIAVLVTGLAYANGYGARSIRRSGPALVNAAVLYCLSVIICLIVALSVKIDFTSAKDLSTFIVVPIVFLFGIVIFGICYHILTRPKKK